MECKLEKQVSVALSMCDNTGKLAIPHIFSLFMDLAAEHGDTIGVGMDVLSQKGLFWLTVKPKCAFIVCQSSCKRLMQPHGRRSRAESAVIAPMN